MSLMREENIWKNTAPSGFMGDSLDALAATWQSFITTLLDTFAMAAYLCGPRGLLTRSGNYFLHEVLEEY